MWIQPLRKQNIIPAERREQFIHAVFCNIMELHAVNARFLAALETRQKENPVVLHIGDIILDFLMDIEPYLQYGARQHEAKFVLDNERMYNPSFASFAQVNIVRLWKANVLTTKCLPSSVNNIANRATSFVVQTRVGWLPKQANDTLGTVHAVPRQYS